MAATPSSMEYVQKMFLAYFGRPVIPTGQEYYGQLVDEGKVAALQDDFWNSAESQALFGNMSTESSVNAIFQQLFSRDANVAGLTYWTAEIKAGRVSLPEAALTILNSAAGADLAVFEAKLNAATAFTQALDTTAEILGYQANIGAGRALMAEVKSAADANDVIANIDARVSEVISGGTAAQNTFTLTNGPDFVTGSSGSDTFLGLVSQNQNGSVSNTLSTGDRIDGGAGVDKIVATLINDQIADGNAVGPLNVNPRTENVEEAHLEVLDLGVTLDAGRMDSVSLFVSDNSDADLTIDDVRLGSKLAITKDITFGLRSVDVDAGLVASFDSASLLAQGASTNNSRLLVRIADVSTETKDTPLKNVNMTLGFTLGTTAYTLENLQSTDGTYDGLIAAVQAALAAKGLGDLTVAAGASYTQVTVAGNTVNLGFTAKEVLITDPAGSAFSAVNFTQNAIAPVADGFLVAGNAAPVAPTVTSNLIETNVILDDAGRGSTAGDVVIGGMSNSNKFVQKANVVVDRSSKIDDISSASNMNAAAVFRAFQEIDVSSTGKNGDLSIGGGAGNLVAGADGVGDVKTFTATSFAGKNLAVTGHAQSVAAYNYDTANAGGSNDTLNLTYDLLDAARAGFSLKVSTGAGKDTVNLLANAAGVNPSDFVNHERLKNVTIDTGAGDDTVTAGRNGSVANINTGADADTIYIAHNDQGAGGKATWLYNATNPAGGLLGTGNNEYQVFKTKVQVSFQGLESKVIAIAWDSTKYTTSAQAINDAIKTAIKDDPVLSKLLEVTDVDNYGIQITSRVDRALVAGDLAVNFIAPTYAPTVEAAGFNQNLSAAYGNDSAVLFAQRDKVTATEMTNAWKAYFPDSTGPVTSAASAVGSIYAATVPGAGGAGEASMYGLMFNAVDGIAAAGLNMGQVAPVAGMTAYAGVNTALGLDSTNASFNVINAGAGNDVIVLNSNVALTDGFETIKLEAGFGYDTILNFNTDTAAPGTTAGDQIDFTAFLDPAAAARGASATDPAKNRVDHSVAYTAANHLGGAGPGTAAAMANFDHNGVYSLDLSEIWAGTGAVANRPVDLDALTAAQLTASLNALVGAGTARFAAALAAVGGAGNEAKVDGIKFVVRVAEDIQYERDGAGALTAGNDIVAPTKEKVFSATVKWDAAKTGGAGYVFTLVEQGTLDYGKMFSDLTDMGADNVAGTTAAVAAAKAVVEAAKVATDLNAKSDITVATNGELTSTTGSGNDTVTFAGGTPVTKAAGTVTVGVTNNSTLTYGANAGTPIVTVTAGSTVTGTAANLHGKTVTGAGAVTVTKLDETAGADLSKITVTGTKTANIASNVTFTGDLGTFGVINLASAAGLSVAHTVVTGKTFAINGVAGGATEALNVAGAAGTDDTIDLSGITATNVVVNIDGDTGNDTITGTAGADNILGGAGDDTINGNGGADVITGGAGDDTINITDAGTTSASSATIVFAANAADNGEDTIIGFKAGETASGGDVLNVAAFLGAAPSALVAVVADDATGNQVVANRNILRVTDAGDDLDAAGIAALFGGGGKAFGTITAGDKYVLITDAGKIWFLDTALDANNADLTASDIVQVGTIGTVALAELVPANFGF